MANRYVEILEQRQDSLIDGLLNLYRLAITGDCWQGDQVILKPNGQPFIDDLLSRLGALSQGTKTYAQLYSAMGGTVSPGLSHAVPKFTQSPVIPLPFLPGSPYYDESNQTTSFSSSTTTLDRLAGDTWESQGLLDVGAVEGFINPLALHRMDDGDDEKFAQVDEHSMTTSNKNVFSADPDMLLFDLSAYIFTNRVFLSRWT